jgi:hypothetical protein
VQRENQRVLSLILIIDPLVNPAAPVETTTEEPARVQDEPLFVDDMSDIDMDDFFRGSQNETGETIDSGTLKDKTVDLTQELGENDDFEDEWQAMNDLL